jgi:hypothetical protein
MLKDNLPLVRRVVLPLVLVTGGIAAVVYGARHHSKTVFAQHDEEQTIDVRIPGPVMPRHFQPSPFGGPPGFPFGDEPEFRTVKKRVLVPVTTSSVEFEPALMREITFGGIEWRDTRGESGEPEGRNLWKTYSGQPPSLCPT